MNNPELTKWLLKVRNALAESDEVRRNSMLRTAERFLKQSNQQWNRGVASPYLASNGFGVRAKPAINSPSKLGHFRGFLRLSSAEKPRKRF
jgi:hypothetical protein